MTAQIIRFPKQPKPRPVPPFDVDRFLEAVFEGAIAPYRHLIQPSRDQEESK